ncbi:THAP domain-containing protein 5-like isoform X4 [Neoarius graeffei]|uniref:THAP domain-containing protein 5-like isoform X4 n=1 Tax=Neoarius graeffei TaxID=443677 RepID=UPI00298C415A|nr:THAP domain-containing protein 5-like isoform X4 [Neoarius graeffei]
MPYCCAVNCRNGTGSGRSFYLFPTEKKRRREWTVRVKRDGWQPGKYATLCSDHFDDDSFLKNPHLLESLGISVGQRRLKPDAVPTKFEHEVKQSKKKRTSNAQAKRRRLEVIADLLIADTQPVNQEKSTSQTLLGNHVGCQTDPPGRSSQGTQLSLRTLSPRVRTKGTQVTGSVNVEVGTTTTDAPWTKRCPLASPPFKAPRPAKRPRLDFEEEDKGELSTEVPEPQAPTDDPVESVIVTIESSQFSMVSLNFNALGLPMFKLRYPFTEGGHILSLQILLNSMNDFITLKMVTTRVGFQFGETSRSQTVPGQEY